MRRRCARLRRSRRVRRTSACENANRSRSLGRQLEHELGRERLVKRRGEVLAFQVADPLERLELELGSDHGGDREQPDAGVAERGEAEVDDLADALGQVRARQRKRPAAAVGLGEVAHDLLHEERVAGGLAADRVHQLGRQLATGQAAGKLGDVDVAEPGERHALEQFLLGEALQRLRKRASGRGFGLPLRGEHEHADSGRDSSVWRSSATEDWSAQWRSSSTSRTGASADSSASSEATASNSR